MADLKKRTIDTSRLKRPLKERVAELPPDPVIDREPAIYREKRLVAGRVEVVPGQAPDSVRLIDWKLVKEMLEVGCDVTDCAARMGITKAQMKDRCLQEQFITWGELEQKCSSNLRYQLKVMQKRKALGYDRKGADGKVYHIPPDTQMLIHLGKHILGQTEKIDISLQLAGYIIEDETGRVVEDLAAFEDIDYEDVEDPHGILNGRSVVDMEQYEDKV